MKGKPNFLKPKMKKGKLRIKRKILSDKGVTWLKKNEVPEKPPSYKPMGVKNKVTPVALMMPANVKNKKLTQCNLANSSLNHFFKAPFSLFVSFDLVTADTTF